MSLAQGSLHAHYRRDIPIGVSLNSTRTGTAFIEQLVESQKSTRTANQVNTVLSNVSYNIYDLRTNYNAMNAWGCLYMPYFLKKTLHTSINNFLFRCNLKMHD